MGPRGRTATPGRGWVLVSVLVLTAVLVGAAPAVAGPRDTGSGVVGLSSPAVPARTVATPDAGVLTVDHPGLALRYEVRPDVVDRQVQLLTIDRSDPDAPEVLHRTALHAVTAPRSLAVDGRGGRLYVAVGTNTHVLDLSTPRAPALLGRLADYMVRSHDHVQTMLVDDPVLGLRELLLISSRLGGSGCWTGTLHVYDTTGAWRDAPVQVLESDVPAAAADGDCPTPQLRTDGAGRRLSLTWGTPAGLVRRDHVLYDVTPAYVALVGVCPIARAA